LALPGPYLSGLAIPCLAISRPFQASPRTARPVPPRAAPRRPAQPGLLLPARPSLPLLVRTSLPLPVRTSLPFPYRPGLPFPSLTGPDFPSLTGSDFPPLPVRTSLPLQAQPSHFGPVWHFPARLDIEIPITVNTGYHVHLGKLLRMYVIAGVHSTGYSVPLVPGHSRPGLALPCPVWPFSAQLGHSRSSHSVPALPGSALSDFLGLALPLPTRLGPSRPGLTLPYPPWPFPARSGHFQPSLAVPDRKKLLAHLIEPIEPLAT